MSRPHAYSYVRFSTHIQSEGHSFERQTTAAQDFAQRNNLDLVEDFKDLGFSAFKHHSTRPGLSAFLSLAQQKKIPSGSFFLIEQLDRLSRADPFEAFTLLKSIVDCGIVVVDLSRNIEYRSDNISSIQNLFLTLADFHRANQESVVKSQRIKASWQSKREKRVKKLTTECPGWLRWNEEAQSFELLEDKSESVLFVIKQFMLGRGNVWIASEANRQNLPCPGKGSVWHPTLVSRILKNTALFGQFQPHVKHDGKRIPYGDAWSNYYPPLISQAEFSAIQQEITKRSELRIPRHRDNAALNIFQGLVFCKHCQKPFNRHNKSNKYQATFAQYYCSNRSIAKTDCPTVSAMILQRTILVPLCEYFNTYFSLKHPDANYRYSLTEKLIFEVKIRDLSEQIARLLDILTKVTSESALDRLNKLEEEKRQLEHELQFATHQDETWIFKNPHNCEIKHTLADNFLFVLKQQLKTEVDIELRQTLTHKLRELVSRIEVDSFSRNVTIHISPFQTSFCAKFLETEEKHIHHQHNSTCFVQTFTSRLGEDHAEISETSA